MNFSRTHEENSKKLSVPNGIPDIPIFQRSFEYSHDRKRPHHGWSKPWTFETIETITPKQIEFHHEAVPFTEEVNIRDKRRYELEHRSRSTFPFTFFLQETRYTICLRSLFLFESMSIHPPNIRTTIRRKSKVKSKPEIDRSI